MPTNEPLRETRHADWQRANPEIPLPLKDSDFLLAEVKRNALPGMLIKDNAELYRIYAQAMEGVSLPADAAAKAAFLQHLRRPITRLFQDLLNVLAPHTDAFIAQTWPSLRQLIDVCMSARDPLQYAAFLDEHVRSPMAFLNLAPLYAEGLVSFKVNLLSEDASAAHTVFCTSIDIVQESIDSLMIMLHTVAEIAGLDPQGVAVENKQGRSL